MLQVGMTAHPHKPSDFFPTHLTPDEQYTQMSLWCLLAAPLLLSCDIASLDDFTLNLLTNDEVLNVNQDPLGEQAKRIVSEHFKDTSTYNAAYGIRTLSKMEKMYDVRATGNPSSWLGPIWGVSNYMVFNGLLKYGYEEENIAN